MNAQNPGQAKPSDPKSDDAAKAPKPDVVEIVAEPAAEKAVEVTLKHPTTGDKVKAAKPSAEYTNFVRGYGYQEGTK